MNKPELLDLIKLLRDEGVAEYVTPEITLRLYHREPAATPSRPQTVEEMQKQAEREAAEHDAILFAAVGGPS